MNTYMYSDEHTDINIHKNKHIHMNIYTYTFHKKNFMLETLTLGSNCKGFSCFLPNYSEPRHNLNY